MNAEWVRAWRYLHKYAIGLILIIQGYAIIIGISAWADFLKAGTYLLRNDINTVIAVAAILLAAIIGAALLDLFVALAGILFATFGKFVLPTSSLGHSSRRLRWFGPLFLTTHRLFFATIQMRKDVILDFLYTTSLGNVLKDKHVELTKRDKVYFDRVISLFQNAEESELTWQLAYAAQLTQDRREVDALQTEFILAVGYALSGMLALVLLAQNCSYLTTRMNWGILLADVMVISAAIGYALRSRRKKIAHMLSLLVQYFSWGDTIAVEDREAT